MTILTLRSNVWSTLIGLVCTIAAALAQAESADSRSAHRPPLTAESFQLFTFGSPTARVIQPTGINNDGRIVGQYLIAVGERILPKAFVWSRRTGLRTLPDIEFAMANAINECGEIAGTSVHSIAAGTQMEVVQRAARWTRAGEFQLLNDLTDTRLELIQANDINNRGHIAGAAFDPDQNRNQVGFFWSRARGAVRIEGLSPGAIPFPLAVNDEDEVIGVHIGPIVPGGENTERAFLWTRKHGMRILGTLGLASFAQDINNRGEVVGILRLPLGKVGAFRWTRHRGMVELEELAAGTSFARSINELGLIVGQGRTPASSLRPLIWPPHAPAFVLQSDSLGPTGAVAVNDVNQVVGQMVSGFSTIVAMWSPIGAREKPPGAGRRGCLRREWVAGR